MSNLALTIEINGEALEQSWDGGKGVLQRVEVTKGLNEHSWCTVEFSKMAASRPSIESWVGQSINLRSTAGTKLFSGFVQDARLTYETSGAYRVVLRSTSITYKLDLAKRFFYYGTVSVSDVAQQIAGRTGVQIGVRQGGGVIAPLDLVQWEETDWHFLWRLCDDLGLYLVETDTGLRIDQGFSLEGPALRWRSDRDTGIVEFTVGGSLGVATIDGCHYDFSTSTSQSFEKVQKQASLSGALGPFADAVTQQSKSILPSAYKGGRHRTKTVASYQESLENEAEWSLNGRLLCSGITRCESIAPGQSVQVSDVDGASGKFHVVTVAHIWSPDGYLNHFKCTPWTGWRSTPHPESPRIQGVYSARVVSVDDPQRQGQVKVQYYWQEQGQTGWIRHLTPYAGADRGFFFRPELGDEVLVAFEAGDPERPVILGSAWNSSDGTPNEDFWGGETHANDVKRIVTKSGHRISLIDKDGAESIAIATPSHAKLVLHEKLTETGRPAILMNVDHGDLIFNAPNGRIHFNSKYWSREVGE